MLNKIHVTLIVPWLGSLFKIDRHFCIERDLSKPFEKGLTLRHDLEKGRARPMDQAATV